MSDTMERTLDAHHLQMLAKHWAISHDTIEATGAWTANTTDDLPESLRFRTDLPGIVFVLEKKDGTRVFQYRPDEPGDGFPKYGQEPKSGSVINLHPVMRDRLAYLQDNDRPFHSVAVEGTKQCLTFVENAPAEIEIDGENLPLVAFGTQGCGNWSEDGVPISDLDDVLAGAKTLTVLFDGDRTSKWAVWQAGSTLKDHAELVGVEKVRFSSVAGGSKADLDGVLSKRAEGEPRRRYVLGVLNKATTNMGRCPAKPKAVRGRRAQVARVDWQNGVIYAPNTIHEVNGEEIATPSNEILAEFVARIVRTRQIIDDLNQADVDLEHDLEVRICGINQTFEIRAVPDSLVRDIAYWRNRAGRGEASRKFHDSSDMGVRMIEQAVRAFEEDEAVFVQAYKRVGWIQADGTWHYLTPTGGISAYGVNTNMLSSLDNITYRSHIQIPDPTEHDAAAHRQALREYTLIGRDRLFDPLAWYAVVGSMAYASTGAAPRAGLLVVGKHGSGKTVVTQTAASAYGPDFHAEGGVLMGSMNGTGNAVSAAGTGLHHMAVIVDDVRRRQNPKRQDEQDAAVEDLIRKSYEGGSAGRARQRVDRNRNGRIVTDAPDACCPLVIFTGEYSPSAEAVGSSVERLLTISLTKHDTMKPGETENMKAIGQSGRPAIAWSGLLQWQASKIAALGSHKAWVDQIDARRVQAAEMIGSLAKGMGTPLSARAQKVAAPPVVGWTLLMEYAAEIGAITPDEARDLSLDAAKRITGAAKRHTAVEMAEDFTGPARMLHRIQAARSAGDVRFEEDLEEILRFKPVIGKRRDTKAIDPETGAEGLLDTIALNPDAIAKALGSGITGTQVIDALKEKCLARPNGRYGWKVTINGAQVQNALVMKFETWDGGSDD